MADAPTKESHDFSGWSGYPEELIMPAADVIISGSFTYNGIAGVSANDPASAKTYFDLTGKPLAQPQRGLNVVKSADGKVRKVIMSR